MTLADLLPSLRSFAAAESSPLADLAAEHGTPLHLLDSAEVHRRCADYAAAFGAGHVSYSAKAGLVPGLGRWIAAAGLGCYAGGREGLRAAVRAGFPGGRLTLCGATRTVADLDAAFDCGAAVVARSVAAVETLARRAPYGQRVLLRVRSATAGTTAGFALGSGTTLNALARLVRSRNLVFAGLDLAVGHRLSRFGGYEAHVREAAAFCAVVQARFRRPVPALNLGGGYSDDFATAAFAARIRGVLALAAERHGIVAPVLTVSPGHALVGPAGTTIWRLGDAIPECVCGGEHTATLIGRVSRAPLRPVVLAGMPVMLPADAGPGDLVAVGGTGAYHHGADGTPVLGLPGREPLR